MIGVELSPVLEDIETLIWDSELNSQSKPNYTDEGFRAALKIATSALMDKIWDLAEKEKMDQEDRHNLILKFATEFRKMVKTYADIDTHELYNK